MVSFDPNDYVFTSRITISRAITLATSGPSILFGQFTVTGTGISATSNVSFGATATGAVFTVNSANAEMTDIHITNPNGVLRPTGIQLGAAVSGVAIDGFQMDGGDQPSSFGINLTTGSATIFNPVITGVATGIGITATSSASSITVTGGSITASLAGIALGSTKQPRVSGVTLSGPGATGTGIDLANSVAATIVAPVVDGFARGIGMTGTNTATGPTISDAIITGATREGISLGSTDGASITDAVVTGLGTASSIGINLYLASGVTIDNPTVSTFPYGIYTNIGDAGVGPVISSPVIRQITTGGITLGSTQGATITHPQISGVTPATGINLMNAGRVTVSDGTFTGMLYGIATTSQIDASSDRTNLALTNITVVGAPVSSSGISLLGAKNSVVTNLQADVTGAAVVVHDSTNVQSTHVIVTGHEGATSTTGSAVLRAYDSQNINVDDSSIDAGSYGFFYSSTSGSTITNARVSNVVEYALYGRSLTNLDVSASTFTGNRAVGNLLVTTPASGVSRDIRVHDVTMTDNRGGLNLYTGTSDVRFTDNIVSGQPYTILAAPAHDVTVSDNSITQSGAADQAAIMVVPLFEDGAKPGSYSSSAIAVLDNQFTGTGTWIQVGSPGPTPDAAHRTLQDPLMVTGNTFPADSTAIQTFPNAVVGDDSVAAVSRAARVDAIRVDSVPPVAGPVAVDARDYSDPNDWGATCKATGYLDSTLVYDGGGSRVYELSIAPVLYPTNCIDLSLTETVPQPTGTALGVGDTVTWSLTPHNDGPRAAPSGWTITQLLPAGAELVSLSGPGYATHGLTATASAALPAGDDGPPLTVTVRIIAVPDNNTTIKDVSYISPAPPRDIDGDGSADVMIEHLGPLVVPTISTDTATSATDNDAQGYWTVAASGPVPSGGGGSAEPAGALSFTGVNVSGAVLFSLAALTAGVGVVALSRIHRKRQRPHA
jgi:hypothetical protein